MSWGGYITNLVADGKVVEKAAICGKEPLGCWAASDGFKVSDEEVDVLFSKDESYFQTNGVKLNGTKFMLVRYNFGDPEFPCLQLRCKQIAATVGKTITTCVVGVGAQDAQAGMIANEVFKTTDYLRKAGC